MDLRSVVSGCLNPFHPGWDGWVDEMTMDRIVRVERLVIVVRGWYMIVFG